MNTQTTTFVNDAMDGDTMMPRSRIGVDRVLKSLRNFATLSEALRILGAGVLLASMSVFLLQGWSEGNDIRRYLLLLAQTGLLGAAGFAMSHVVRETRGARLFFGLALVSVPANFTILGALLYSVFQWDGGLTTYPGFADWRIDDVANIGLTLGGALAVLVPVTAFCFMVMARHSAKALAFNFLALNALLLLPVRSSVAAGMIALAGVVYALTVAGRLSRNDTALKTGEGKFALATMFIPSGIILFRSVYFYQLDSLMIGMIGLVLFLAARQASLFPGRNTRLAVALDVLSWPLAMIVSVGLADALAPALATGFEAPALVAIYAALAFDVVRRTRSQVLARMLGGSVSIVLALAFTLSVLLSGNAASALFSLFGGLLVFLWGAAARKPVPIVAGAITLGGGALFGFDAIVRLVVTSSWIDLAIFGASAIALGSVLDRHGAAIKLHLARRYRNVREEMEVNALDERQSG